MSIGRNLPKGDGGLGTLTPSEEVELSDLLNGPHKLCECGDAMCGCPILRDPEARPGG